MNYSGDNYLQKYLFEYIMRRNINKNLSETLF